MATKPIIGLVEDDFVLTFTIEPDVNDDGAVVQIRDLRDPHRPMAFCCATWEMRAVLVDVIRRIDELAKAEEKGS